MEVATYYFSGVAGPSEADFLRAASVQHVLVDPVDLAHGNGFAHVVLDSGAYRCFKRGTPLDAAAYQAFARAQKVDWHLAPDVIGDPEATERNWDTFRQPSMVPVWGFGSDRRLLHKYLDASERVAIGGLVTRMREKDEAMLKDLTALCEEFPGVFHILGGNWLRAACQLKDLVRSLDSAEWLVGGRYGFVVFLNTRSRQLQRAPARVLGFGHLSRAERNIACARALDAYFNGSAQASTSPAVALPRAA